MDHDRAQHEPTRADFEHLLAFRTSLRRFQRWSEDQARVAGLTQVQHQLLVAVKGHPSADPPTVSDLADYLLLRHNSTVELIDRAELADLVRRMPDARDARLVRVRLTARAERILRELTPAHLVELHGLAAVLDELVAGARAQQRAGPPATEQTATAVTNAGGAITRPARPLHIEARYFLSTSSTWSGAERRQKGSPADSGGVRYQQADTPRVTPTALTLASLLSTCPSDPL